MTIEVDVPQLTWNAVPLALDERTTKGGTSRHAPARLSECLRLGKPVAALITPELAGGEDSFMKALTEQEKHSHYHLVALGCTFEPTDEVEFTRAWVRVSLSAKDGQDAPVAWSMLPTRESQPLAITRTLGLTPKITLPGTSIEPGPSLSSAQSYAKDDIFVEALNLLRSDPTWVFARTRGVEIRGSHMLMLVVRARRPGGSGEVLLRAQLRHQRFGVLSYAMELPENVAGSFILEATK